MKSIRKENINRKGTLVQETKSNILKQVGVIFCCVAVFTMVGCTQGNLTEQEEGQLQSSEEVQVSKPKQGGSQELNVITASENNTDEDLEQKYEALKVECLEEVKVLVKQFELSKSIEELQALLKQAVNDHVQYAYIGFSDDKILIEPSVDFPENYETSKRRWYKESLEKPYYTDMYEDAIEEMLIYTVAMKLDNEILGESVVAIDFILESDPVACSTYMDALYNKPITSEELEALQKRMNPTVFLTEYEIQNWKKKMDDIDFRLTDYSSKESIETFLVEVLGHNEDLRTVFLASPEGQLFGSEEFVLPEGYDPRQRPWYPLAVEKKEIHVSDPWNDFETGLNMITLCLELENAPESGWVLGLDIIEK